MDKETAERLTALETSWNEHNIISRERAGKIEQSFKDLFALLRERKCAIHTLDLKFHWLNIVGLWGTLGTLIFIMLNK